MSELNELVFGIPTVGENPAATYSFMSSGYQPPRQGRTIGLDVVHNHSGIFKYVYDNGPGIFTWDPFELVFDDAFATQLGAMATQQWANFLEVWNHIGSKSFQSAEDVYQIHFSPQDLQRRFIQYPRAVGDKIEFRVTVQIEEG